MALFASKYYAFDPSVYFQKKVYEAHTLGLYMHISGMMFAVVLGPLQFLRPLRDRHFRLHRVLGRIYIAGAIVGALGGLYMAPHSRSGVISDVAFALLGVGVLVTTTLALLRIRSGNVQNHREWMTRSYALIFGAFTLRLYFPSLDAVMSEYTSYAIAAWVCWVANLVFAEWLIRSKLRRHPEVAKAPRVEAAVTLQAT